MMALTSQVPLEDAYAQMGLNEVEDVELEIDVNVVNETPLDYRWALVGRLLGTGNVVFEAFQQLLASLWHPVRGVSIRELGEGRYLFLFFHEMDLQRMLNYGPWTFGNRVLVTHRI